MAGHSSRGDSETKIIKKPKGKFDKILVIDVILGVAWLMMVSYCTRIMITYW